MENPGPALLSAPTYQQPHSRDAVTSSYQDNDVFSILPTTQAQAFSTDISTLDTAQTMNSILPDDDPFGIVQPGVIPPSELASNDLIMLSQNDSNSMIKQEESVAAVSQDEEEHDQSVAFARLSFHDSYYLIRTSKVVIGRDPEYWRQHKESLRRKEAVQALDAYSKEPSQHSQFGDEYGDLDEQAPSLAEFIPPAPPSNFSGHGGPVSYESGEPYAAARRRHKRNLHESSSANSVNLTNIELKEIVSTQARDKDGNYLDPEEWAKLPVHTAKLEDIMLISRDHLLIRYDSDDNCWRLDVLGNNAFVNGEFIPKGKNGLQLGHGDEIYIASIYMTFELPQDEDTGMKQGDLDDNSQQIGSPLSGYGDDGDSDDEDEDGSRRRSSTTSRPKIMLNLNARKSLNEVPSTGGKGGKGGKTPATPSGAPETPIKEDPNADPNAETSQPQAGAEPSIFSSLSRAHQPEKRKGPGRPPKNGLVSKRDENAVKKLLKERKKNGQEVNDAIYAQLLEQVRQEQKRKDAQNKAQANGQPMPDIPMPSIENESRPDGTPVNTSQMEGVQPTAMPTFQKQSSPKLPRQFSPMPPRESFTEEQMKKPIETYPYLLDQVMEIIEKKGLQGDLPTIYDQFMKRWPYFKYESGTIGWQSSIRHNLQSDVRFVDAGKAGKGKLWKIDHNAVRETKKQPRQPQPSNVQPPQGYGGMQQGQYGHGPYAGTFNQAPHHGQGQVQYNNGAQTGQYNSPYSSYGQNQNMPPRNNNRPPHPPAQQRPGAPPRPVNQPPPQENQSPFHRFVADIMAYRQNWLGRFVVDSSEYVAAENDFKDAVGHFSDLFHQNHTDTVVSAEAAVREPFTQLKVIYERYKPYMRQQESNGNNPPQPAAPAASNSAPSAPNGVAPTPAAAVPPSNARPPGPVANATPQAQVHQQSAPQAPMQPLSQSQTPMPAQTPSQQSHTPLPPAAAPIQILPSPHPAPNGQGAPSDPQPQATASPLPANPYPPPTPMNAAATPPQQGPVMSAAAPPPAPPAAATPQIRPPSSAGVKRAAEGDDVMEVDQPDSKRVKNEDAAS